MSNESRYKLPESNLQVAQRAVENLLQEKGPMLEDTRVLLKNFLEMLAQVNALTIERDNLLKALKTSQAEVESLKAQLIEANKQNEEKSCSN